MDTLINKRYKNFDYTSRYTGVPYYYDKRTGKDIYGIGTPMFRNTAWVAHKIVQGDTLDSLALKYYNNPTYWWVIAYFNKIQDPFIELSKQFVIIKIPAIASIEFGNERQ